MSNAGFTRVLADTQRYSDLSATNVNAGYLDAENLTKLGTRQYAIGYTPTGYAAAAPGTFPLMTAPNQTAATAANTAGAIQLPSLAIVTQITLIPTGTATNLLDPILDLATTPVAAGTTVTAATIAYGAANGTDIAIDANAAGAVVAGVYTALQAANETFAQLTTAAGATNGSGFKVIIEYLA